MQETLISLPNKEYPLVINFIHAVCNIVLSLLYKIL